MIAAAETVGQMTVTAGLAPGDSGGGLFGANGQLLGVNRAIYDRNGVGQVIPTSAIESLIQSSPL